MYLTIKRYVLETCVFCIVRWYRYFLSYIHARQISHLVIKQVFKKMNCKSLSLISANENGLSFFPKWLSSYLYCSGKSAQQFQSSTSHWVEFRFKSEVTSVKSVISLGADGRRFGNFVVTGGTVGCHYDNLPCRPWRHGCRVGDLLFSVFRRQLLPTACILYFVPWQAAR